MRERGADRVLEGGARNAVPASLGRDCFKDALPAAFLRSAGFNLLWGFCFLVCLLHPKVEPRAAWELAHGAGHRWPRGSTAP